MYTNLPRPDNTHPGEGIYLSVERARRSVYVRLQNVEEYRYLREKKFLLRDKNVVKFDVYDPISIVTRKKKWINHFSPLFSQPIRKKSDIFKKKKKK